MGAGRDGQGDAASPAHEEDLHDDNRGVFHPIFISHGGPPLALDPAEGGFPSDKPLIAFLNQYGAALQRRPPRAILVCSAHFDAEARNELRMLSR